MTDICLSKREKKRCIILQEGEIFLPLAMLHDKEMILLFERRTELFKILLQKWQKGQPYMVELNFPIVSQLLF